MHVITSHQHRCGEHYTRGTAPQAAESLAHLHQEDAENPVYQSSAAYRV